MRGCLSKRALIHYAFVSAVAAALTVIFHIRTPVLFVPAVELPEVQAGEAFRSWNGIVVTRLPDGRFDIDGETVKEESATKALEKAVRTREEDSERQTKSVRLQVSDRRLTMVPVLVCIDRKSPVSTFFDVLNIIYPAGCANVYIACSAGGECTALSLCSLHAGSCSHFDSYLIWHERVRLLRKNIHEITPLIGEDGWWDMFYEFHKRWFPIKPMIIYKEGNKPPAESGESPTSVYKTIDPLFEKIEEHKDGGVLVKLDLNQRADSLTWDWLVKLLARLEKTHIKGYCFAAPDVSF